MLPEIVLLHPLKYHKEIKEYKTWITRVFSSLAQKLVQKPAAAKWSDEEVSELIEFEMKLATLRNVPDKYEPVTLKDFAKHTRIDWKEALKEFFPETKRFDSHQLVIVKCRNYAKQLLNLLRVTKSRTVGKVLLVKINYCLMLDFQQPTSSAGLS